MPPVGQLGHRALQEPAYGRDRGREMHAELLVMHVVHDAEDGNVARHGPGREEGNAVLAVENRVEGPAVPQQPAEDQRIDGKPGPQPDDLDAIPVLGCRLAFGPRGQVRHPAPRRSRPWAICHA